MTWEEKIKVERKEKIEKAIHKTLIYYLKFLLKVNNNDIEGAIYALKDAEKAEEEIYKAIGE